MYEIRMAHPAKNALGTELIRWLENEFEQAGDQPVLLTGTGDAFCAGLNLKEVASNELPEMERMLVGVDELAARIFNHPAPTVALVNGHAIAGGCVLAMCCDYRVAVDDERLRMGLNEVALGACFPPRILNIVRHRMHAGSVEDVLLGAGLFDAHAALRRGLLDDVSDDAEAAANKWLERAARHPRGTYALTKSVLHAGVAELSAEETRRFREVELPIWTSPEIKERVRAILAR
ncbi:MAG: enoyl-CoA hydratase/isomerase family protein [Planctomycetota bacterium]